MTTESEGVATPPAFIATLRKHGGSEPVTAPLSTVTTSGHHHYLGHFPERERALVVPYRKNNRTATTDEPLLTMGTRDPAALVRPQLRIEDCYWRMLSPREQLRAQRFPDTYQVKGNQEEQTAQAGNAVSPNVAHWHGRAVAAVLG